MQREEGASLDELVAATGWQKHSVRGLISGALKKKLGLTVTTEKTAEGTVYHMRRPPVRPPVPSKLVDVADDVGAIALADRPVLLEEWQALYGSSVPKNISTLLLRRAVAHRLQEKARGGLKPALRQYLRQVAQSDNLVRDVKAPEPALASGSRLIREWNGKTYEVTMLAEGQFEMDGKTIAR